MRQFNSHHWARMSSIRINIRRLKSLPVHARQLALEFAPALLNRDTAFQQKARLDGLKNGRPHRQDMLWDSGEPGLCVLISRGPKHKRKATVTFRVVYYLKDRPGEPRYMKLGRYPDECSDIDGVRDRARYDSHWCQSRHRPTQAQTHWQTLRNRRALH